jgi:hypothetical protein
MQKTGAAVTTLELAPPVGKSYLVKNIHVKSVAGGYLTIKIDRVTVGYFRVSTTLLGNLLAYPLPDLEIKTILALLAQLGMFTGYPIAEGQTLELSGLGAGAMTATIIYEEYDAGDITAALPNGTGSPELLYIAFGDTGAAIGAAGDNLFDTPRLPTEMPAFPFGADVPPRTVIELLGILASERGADDGAALANYIHTTYLKLMRGREVLFDRDRKGLYIQGATVAANGAFEPENGQGILGEYSDLARRLPFFFATPLVFEAGEELNIYVTTEVAGTPGTFPVAEQEIGLICRMKVA